MAGLKDLNKMHVDNKLDATILIGCPLVFFYYQYPCLFVS